MPTDKVASSKSGPWDTIASALPELFGDDELDDFEEVSICLPKRTTRKRREGKKPKPASISRKLIICVGFGAIVTASVVLFVMLGTGNNSQTGETANKQDETLVDKGRRLVESEE
jgi:hypothetical protein